MFVNVCVHRSCDFAIKYNFYCQFMSDIEQNKKKRTFHLQHKRIKTNYLTFESRTIAVENFSLIPLFVTFIHFLVHIYICIPGLSITIYIVCGQPISPYLLN